MATPKNAGLSGALDDQDLTQSEFRDQIGALVDTALDNKDQVDFNVGSASQPLNDADQLLVRQGSTNKKVPVSAMRTELATDAVLAQNAAEAAQASAEAARDAAVTNSTVYADTATGLAAVADGEYFNVIGSGNIASYLYKRIDASTAQLISSYPSGNAVIENRAISFEFVRDVTLNGQLVYTGTGPLYPLATDASNKIILGFDEDTTSIVALGALTAASPDGLHSYTGTGPIYPLVTDANNKIILGFNKDTNSLVALGALTAASPDGLHSYTGTGPIYPLVTDANNKIILGFNKDTNKVIGDFEASGSSAGVQVSGKAPTSITEADFNHFLFYGQSLSVGAAAGSVISTTQPYSNITFQGGPRAYDGSAFSFSPFKPLVEDANNAPDGGSNRKETICSGAANYASRLMAIENGVNPVDHVILASTAGNGGEPIDDLDKPDASDPGETWYNDVFLEHVTQANAIAGSSSYAVHAVGWLQGENDNSIPTPVETYKQEFIQLQADAQADIQAITGQTTPVYFITYQTCTRSTEAAPMLLPQLELAQTNPNFFLASPLYHLPHSDSVHLTAVGYKWLGAYFGRAYKQVVIDKREPDWLNPVSATLLDGVVRVRFEVPELPLVLDTTTLAATTDYGFRLVDDNGTVSIETITIGASGNEVLITPVNSTTGSIQVRYARDYLGAGLSINNGASGNLRDSTLDSTVIGGTTYPLYHVCPHFQLDVIPIAD